MATCPNCGRPANIVSGTYDFVDGVVRLVRDANLTLAQVNELRRAAAQARRTGQVAEEFISANPVAAPIVNLLVQQAPGRDWLIVLLMVLTIVVGVLQMGQNAEYHADDQRQRKATPTPSTLTLTNRQLDQITQRVTAKLQMRRNRHHLGGAATRPQAGNTARKKRPPKRYGQAKHKRRR